MEKNNKNDNEGKKSFLKIKKEDQRMLLVSIIMIIFLIFMSYDRINDIDLSETGSQDKGEKSPLVNIPSLEDLTSPEYLDEMMKEIGIDQSSSEDEYTTYILEDGFQFSYPSSWSLVNINQRNVQSLDDAEVVFMAHSKSITKQGNILILKIEANNTEEVIEILEKLARNEDEEIKISQPEDFILEIERKTSEEVVPFSWQKIIFANENCYLLSINFSKEDKASFEKIKNNVFSSVKIIEK